MPYLPISANPSDLFDQVPKTYLASEALAAASNFSVESIRDFAINKILFVGDIGAEDSEIIKTHSATAPSGSTVTLAAATVFNHPNGTAVYVLDYDQVEFSHSVTIDGVKTVMDTLDIDADSEKTTYRDTAYNSGYYFIRFKNSITSVFSGYSAPIPYAGWADNQVGSAIDYAMSRNKASFSENLTHDFLIVEANACIQFMRGKLKRWSNLQNFDYSLGAAARGAYSLDMPDDAYPFSNKSILQAHIGRGRALGYLDKREFDEKLEDVTHTNVTSSVLVGATSMTIDDAKDIDDAGTIMVGGVQITYTAKDDSTGTLTGIPASGTGSVTAALSAGDDVWQGAWSEGDPRWFSVWESKFYWWPLVTSTLAGQNVFADYWKEAPTISSDADTLDLTRYDAVKHWLTWVVRSQVKFDGERKADDSDYLQFSTILSDSITMELKVQGQKYKMKPKIHHTRF